MPASSQASNELSINSFRTTSGHCSTRMAGLRCLAHSLRAGFLTSAATRGASIFKLADQSRHKSMDVLRGCVRNAELFKNHAGDGLL
jgi:hypothetical protein